MPNHAFTIKYWWIATQLWTQIHICLPTEIWKPPAQCHLLDAIRDTGATSSTITSPIAKSLWLIPTGKTIVNGVWWQKEEYTYFVSIILPNNVIVPNIMVCWCDKLVWWFDALIGMDIIWLWDLAITKEENKTVMSFVLPSMKTIDFVKKVNDLVQQEHSGQHKKAKEQRKKEKKNKKKWRK